MLNRFNWDTWTNKNYYGTVHLISSDPLSMAEEEERRSIPSFSLAA